MLNKIVTLKSGAKIRFVICECKLAKPTIYQYVVSMLFSNNNWQRIFISSLYSSFAKLFIDLSIQINNPEHFQSIYLAKRAREKYGQEFIERKNN